MFHCYHTEGTSSSSHSRWEKTTLIDSSTASHAYRSHDRHSRSDMCSSFARGRPSPTLTSIFPIAVWPVNFHPNSPKQRKRSGKRPRRIQLPWVVSRHHSQRLHRVIAPRCVMSNSGPLVLPSPVHCPSNVPASCPLTLPMQTRLGKIVLFAGTCLGRAQCI